MEKFDNLFVTLTGFLPYEFQRQCFEKLHFGKSIILQAPTGSGKTLASILPFIQNWIDWRIGKQDESDFPRKLIYSLPLRTLANSIHKEITEVLDKLVLEGKPTITLQTGEYSNDELFEGDIIITTIDQTLSSVLSIPLSLPNKLSNINAGAVLASYLVFDEFHLLEPQKSLSTTLMILNKLKNITPFCLMTATLTDLFVSNLSDFLKCEVVKVDETDYEKFSFIRTNQRQKRFLNVLDKEIETSDIIKLHKSSNKTIIICNTVKSCIEKAKVILNHIKSQNLETEVICLHSRFFQKHRKEKEKKIIEYFGKNSEKENVILITTQIVEVGLDISCNVLLTEVSPINSFLQRIGRSARWGGESQIFVYRPEKEYVYNKEITESTFKVLKENEKEEIDRDLAQQLIKKVLTESENLIFKMIKESNQLTWEKIIQSWQTGNKEFARELIRDIHSINVVLVNESDNISNLFIYESVSMHPHSLKNQLQKIRDKKAGETPNLAFNLQSSNVIAFDEGDEEYKLTSIDINKIEYESIIALNTDYIGYSEITGLDFNDNFGVVSDRIENKKSKFMIKYNYDTFEEHNNWMIDVFMEMYDYQYPLSKIQQKHYQEFDFNDLIKFSIICHDFGKLNKKWQEIVQTYQSLKSGNKVTELLAHTDFDKEDENDVQMMKSVYRKIGLFKKPDHSGIGARFVKYAMPSLFKLKKDNKNKFLVDVLISSIVRHHSAFADSAPKFDIETNIYEDFLIYLNKSIPNLGEITCPKEKLIQSKISLNDLSISFQQAEIAFLYFIIVRILRLCDQKSFKKNPRKED